jgi:cell division protein FtsB
VLVVWAGYTALAGPQGLVRLWELRHREARLRGEVARLRREADSLRALAAGLQRDPFLREKMGREIYGVAGENELIYILREEGARAGEQTPPGREATPPGQP